MMKSFRTQSTCLMLRFAWFAMNSFRILTYWKPISRRLGTKTSKWWTASKNQNFSFIKIKWFLVSLSSKNLRKMAKNLIKKIRWKMPFDRSLLKFLILEISIFRQKKFSICSHRRLWLEWSPVSAFLGIKSWRWRCLTSWRRLSTTGLSASHAHSQLSLRFLSWRHTLKETINWFLRKNWEN